MFSKWNSKESALWAGPYKMPHAEYLAIKGVSNSLLQQVKRSPAHARHMLNNPSEPTPAMEFGTLIHSAILEPDQFKKNYLVTPVWNARTTEGKQAKLDWQASNPDKIALSEEQFTQVLGIVDSVYNHGTAAQLLSKGQSEMSFIHTDKESGLLLKCRPDHIHEEIIVDVKTTEDASKKGFSNSILKFNYHMQAAFYLSLISKVTGQDLQRFVFIAVEKKPPYAVATYELDLASIEKGRDLVARMLERWSACIRQNQFPAYSNEVQTIEIPTWGYYE